MPAADKGSRWLLIVGLAGMLIGAVDPLEGSLIILPGVALVALGVFLGKSRHRRLLYWALALVAVGVGAMWISSAFGGFGGGTGRSLWWGLLILVPYVVGWVMGLVGAVRALVEAFRRRAGSNRGGLSG